MSGAEKKNSMRGLWVSCVDCGESLEEKFMVDLMDDRKGDENF